VLSALLLATFLAQPPAPAPPSAGPLQARPGPQQASAQLGGNRPIKLTLPQLLERARKNPQLEAAAHAVTAAEAQWREAVRAWIPQFEVQGVLSASPDIRCMNGMGQPDVKNCVQTTNVDASLSAIGAGVFGRIELKGGMPLYTFGKLDAVKALATAGVHAARYKTDLTRAELELNVKKAYFGAKVAREILQTVAEGRSRLTEAIDKLEADFDKGEGDASQIDVLRLKAAAAQVDARTLEAEKGLELARAALVILAGDAEGTPLDVDDAPIEPIELPARTDARYLELARTDRVESRLLGVAVAAKKQQLELEIARYYPDLALVGTATYAKATTSDDPQNAFYNDPYNGYGFGVALAIKGTLDYHMKVPRVDKLRAELAELEAHRRAAQGGISLEARKALADLREAQKRLPILQRGKRASRSWLIAITQNFSIGLAEAKDFSDALLAYFEAELRTLQAIYDHDIAVAQLARVTGTDPHR
jgi:outer membrane protein TolC